MSQNPEILKLIKEIGEDRALNELRNLVNASDRNLNVLTIVSNSGAHRLPKEIIKGELYVASKGNFDVTNGKILSEQYMSIAKKLAIKLKEKKWDEIYLVPFGPSTLNMLIKIITFRVTYTDTIDYFYTENGDYLELQLNTRSCILED